jgi:hypothetical protein
MSKCFYILIFNDIKFFCSWKTEYSVSMLQKAEKTENRVVGVAEVVVEVPVE